MIKSSSFIQAHLAHIINFNNLHGTPLLLHHGVSCDNNANVFFHTAFISDLKEEVYTLYYDNHLFDEYSKIGFQSLVPDRKIVNESLRVVGVCNGLVFLADDLSRYGYNFIIWNPAMKKSVTVPKPGLRYETIGGCGYEACHGFAFDVITKDYKVVRVVEEYPGIQTLVEVYSLAAGSWSDSRLVDPQCRLNMASPQAFVDGALHWDVWGMKSSSTRFFILAFDVSSELSREILFPKSLDPHLARPLSLQLSVSGDGKSLAMFLRDPGRSSFLDMWVMKEYSVQESWTKLYNICLEVPPYELLSENYSDHYVLGRVVKQCWKYVVAPGMEREELI